MLIRWIGEIIEMFLMILVLLFLMYTTWYGITIESGDVKIELYGVGENFTNK